MLITPSSSSCMDIQVPPLLSPRCPCWHWEPKGCVLSEACANRMFLTRLRFGLVEERVYPWCMNNMIGSEYRLQYPSTCYLYTDLHRLAARCRGSVYGRGTTDWAGYVASEIEGGDLRVAIFCHLCASSDQHTNDKGAIDHLPEDLGTPRSISLASLCPSTRPSAARGLLCPLHSTAAVARRPLPVSRCR
jgi:hypothetical protein